MSIEPWEWHRWSGWPGAYCLNCGAEDQREICLADHSIPLDAVAFCPEHQNTRCPVWEDLHERALS